jgi:hypothetical protein
MARRLLGEPRDAAKLGVHAGRGDDRLRGSGHDVGAREHAVGRVEPRTAVRPGGRVAAHRTRLTGQRRQVDLELDFDEQPAIGADAIPGGQQHHVPGDNLLGGDLARMAVAAHAHPLGQDPPQRLDRPFGAVLLGETEDSVDDDHRDDRDRQRRHAAEQCQRRPGPQQQREQIGEVAREARDPVGPLALREHVGADTLELAASLLAGEPSRGRRRGGGGARLGDERAHPLRTPMGRSSATGTASPARSTTATTRSTSL